MLAGQWLLTTVWYMLHHVATLLAAVGLLLELGYWRRVLGGCQEGAGAINHLMALMASSPDWRVEPPDRTWQRNL